MRALIVGLVVSVLSIPGAGQAQQWDPEAGDVGNWDPPPPAENAPSGDGWNQTENERPPGMGGGETARSRPRRQGSGNSDHASVVGVVGLGFFGVDAISVDPGVTGDGIVLDAPSIGVRYWTSERMGIDVALGLAFTDFSFSEAGTIARGLKSAFGINLHLGLPIALHARDHFTVELIPEIDFGYGTATLLARDPVNDISFTGMDINIGIRLGGEVQFGFIGLPQLGLQTTIGVGFNYFSQSADGVGLPAVNTDIAAGTETVENSGFALSTTLNNVFEGTVRLVYYLD